MAGRAPERQAGERPGGRARFAVVAARFNEGITAKLVDGALHALSRHGVESARAEVHWVPGSFELPQAAMALARTRLYAAIVCVGVVIRGKTPHFQHISREAAAGIRHVSLATGIPVSFGVVTALTEAQAWDRAGGAVGNRGEEAALAALEMAAFLRRLRRRPGSGRIRSRRR
jgi:6,7-dimethyl-8-ribityllumazine synthase